MSDDASVPEGWIHTTLGELGNYLNGRAFKKAEWSDSGRPIIRIQDLTGSNSNPNHYDGELPDRYVIRPGDFLISWSATLGAYIWDGPEGVLNQHIFKVESNIDQRFHYHLVRHSLGELQRSAHGSGMVHVTKSVFESTPVAIPPDDGVQRSIAAAIDRVDKSHSLALRQVGNGRNAILKLRRAVIAAACVGELTAEWRDSHPETRSVNDRLTEFNDLDSTTRSKATDPPDLEVPELPDTYLLVNVAAVATAIQYGTSKKASVEPNGVPVLRMGNIQGGMIDTADLKYIRPDNEIEGLLLADGDLLFNRTNSPELVGKSAVFRESDDMTFASYLIRVRVDPRVADPDFVAYWINSAWGRMWARHVKTDGVSQSNINGTKLASMPLPLPPIEEQKEIVRRTNEMLGKADALMDEMRNAARAIGRSEDAVLAKAFRGELVPSGSFGAAAGNRHRSRRE